MKIAVRGLNSFNRYRLATGIAVATWSSLFATVGAAAEPQLGDFAAGIELKATADRPVIELPLPDSVYTTVMHWDLADVRVFNAQGIAVPHAFCPAPSANGALQTRELPLYAATAAGQTSHDDTSVIFTTGDGTQLKVTADNDAQLRSGASYVVDTRGIEQPLHALQLDWSSQREATETSLRVLASDDLAHWQTLVASAKLLRAKAPQDAGAATPQQLEQQRIALPAGHYQYVRLEPVAPNADLAITRAHAEYLIPAAPPEPKWFSAGAPHADDDSDALLYESDHRVPVSYLRVLPSTVNSRLHLTVQSRAQSSAPWQTQWSGEIYSLRDNGQERASGPVKISPTSSPYWRLQFEGEPPASAPHFDLGYLPLRLRFLAQGNGPYTLAYGSNRAISANATPCDGLLAGSASPDKHDMIGAAELGETKTLAGATVLGTARELPMRKLVLWGVLLAGVAAVAATAISLLRKKRRKEE